MIEIIYDQVYVIPLCTIGKEIYGYNYGINHSLP